MVDDICTMIMNESTNFKFVVSYNSHTDEDGSSYKNLANNESISEDNPHLHWAYMGLRSMVDDIWTMIVNESTNFKCVMSYNSHTDEDGSSYKYLTNNNYFLSAPQDTRRINLSLDFSIASQHSKKGIKLLANHKYHKKYYSYLQ